jgi:16S rRNA (uracil1498-N3)-methyltransferase
VSDPLFFTAEPVTAWPAVGACFTLTGPDGRHAAMVRRIRPGESIMVGDGHGQGVRGVVREVGRDTLQLEVTESLTAPNPDHRLVVAQALAKGDRAELAVEMLTEAGVDEIVPWQAARSIVRWSGDRATRAWQKWQNTAREAAKQSRRLRVPVVTKPLTTRDLADRAARTGITLVLHEEATSWLAEIGLSDASDIMIIVGPEGGIDPDELTAFVTAGGQPVRISDGVLRTSTAGVVAVGILRAR